MCQEPRHFNHNPQYQLNSMWQNFIGTRLLHDDPGYYSSDTSKCEYISGTDQQTNKRWMENCGLLVIHAGQLGDLKSSTAPPVLLAYVDNNNIPLGIPCWRKTPETAKTTPIPPNSNRSDNNLIDLIEHLFDGMYDYMVAHGPGCRTNIKCKTNKSSSTSTHCLRILITDAL